MNQKETDFRKTPPKAGTPPEIQIGDYQKVTLDNGLQVIVVENHKLPQVSYQLFVDREPFREGEQAGMLNVMGELLSAGTEHQSKAEIDETLDFIGANFSTNSRGARGSVLSPHKEKLVETMAEIILEPSFPEDEFEKIRKQQLSAIEASKNSPDAIAQNIRSLVNFGKDHPYGPFPTEESINAIELSACKAFYDREFQPNFSYFVVVGDITIEEAKSQAEKYFGDWEGSEDWFVESYRTPQPPEENRVVFVDRPGAVQSLINITYPVELNYRSEDYIAARVMNNILGGGVFSGYLMQNLREDKAFTYGARSSLSPDPNIGSFTAFASVRNEVTDSAVTEFLHEMRRIKTDTVDEDQLELVKNSMSGSFARSLENPQTIARQALSIARYELPEDYYDTYLQRLDAINQEDVYKAAQRYILPDRSNILVVGNKDEVAEKLVPFDADGSINYYTPSGEKVEDLSGDIPEGMTAQQVIQDYIEAVGGKSKFEAIETAKMEYSVSLGPLSIEATRAFRNGNSYAEKLVMNGRVIQSEIYNDGEGVTQNPQEGKQNVEGDQLTSLYLNSFIIEEIGYEQADVNVELVGMEEINGQKAYKVKVKIGEEEKVSYFDQKSHLKLRTLTTAEGANGPVTVQQDFLDYKEYNGVKLPSEMKISGAAPQTIRMKTSNFDINPELDSSIFKIE